MTNIWEYKTHPAYTDAERAAFDFAIAASNVPNAVDQEQIVVTREATNDRRPLAVRGLLHQHTRCLFKSLRHTSHPTFPQLTRAQTIRHEQLRN